MRIFLLVIFSSFIFCQNIECQNNLDRGYKVNIGDVAPVFDMFLIDGSQLSSSDLFGKVVVLQFTASWCGVCIKEMPHLEKRVWQRFKSEDFLMIGIDLKEEQEVVKEFIVKTNVTYPIGLDSNGDIFASFTLKGAGVTRNIVLNKSGEIIFLTRLFDEKEFEKMIDVIELELSKT
jgi:peroxiredoxin|tara:strand:- start:529 stop:1056 length:528 start_codon:yes stop_codon:yes gene_type:complete